MIHPGKYASTPTMAVGQHVTKPCESRGTSWMEGANVSFIDVKNSEQILYVCIPTLPLGVPGAHLPCADGRPVASRSIWSEASERRLGRVHSWTRVFNLQWRVYLPPSPLPAPFFFFSLSMSRRLLFHHGAVSRSCSKTNRCIVREAQIEQ